MVDVCRQLKRHQKEELDKIKATCIYPFWLPCNENTDGPFPRIADDVWLLTAALVYSNLSLIMGDLKGRILPNAMLGCCRRRRTGESVLGDSLVGKGDRGGDV